MQNYSVTMRMTDGSTHGWNINAPHMGTAAIKAADMLKFLADNPVDYDYTDVVKLTIEVGE